jgi:hypothetical protein
MKLITVILIMFISSISNAKDLEFGYFNNKDLSVGQNGCWYYHPANKKRSGNVIAFGESADNAINLIINGKKEMIANWKADYYKTYVNISYSVHNIA